MIDHAVRSAEAAESERGADCPVVVDLDGTLVTTNLLWESALLLCRRDPLALFRLPLWRLAGKAYLKQRVAERVVPDARTLPYRGEVLEFLHRQRQAGRRIVLATASNERIVRPVAEYVGVFDTVLASDATTYVAGGEKLRRIRKQCGEFDYVADGHADRTVVAAARHAYVVGAGRSIEPLLRSLRPHQWVKNALLFLPLILAHQVTDLGRLAATAMAAMAFCLCASSIYVFNDLLDIEADRAHPRKWVRPFAAGALSIPAGLVVGVTALAAGLGIATLAGWRFVLALVVYVCLSTAYSLVVKRKLLLDVILLAGLYTIRIVAGALAAAVTLTPWLLAFSWFLFLSLAFAKRYSELAALGSTSDGGVKGRGYRVDDLDVILASGVSSGHAAVVVFCLYINSDVATALYPRAELLWLVCPVLLYWITRIWFLARRRALVDDPVVFAIRDRVSWIAVATTIALMALAA